MRTIEIIIITVMFVMHLYVVLQFFIPSLSLIMRDSPDSVHDVTKEELQEYSKWVWVALLAVIDTISIVSIIWVHYETEVTLEAA